MYERGIRWDRKRHARERWFDAALRIDAALAEGW